MLKKGFNRCRVIKRHRISGKSYVVKWFDPREGGEFQNISITSVKGNGYVSLGVSPSEIDKDWVICIQAHK
ncbi:putative collagen-binding domain-containing protein [uncultured Algibacter sp.]|uniref:putative collagen-binding domain-containing protein n=1 Tax=uncultured Algibacter sp. TaxID=298659 RepID=UPI0034589A8A